MTDVPKADTKDVSMVDVSNMSEDGDKSRGGSCRDGGDEVTSSLGRRKSTIILTEEDQMNIDKQEGEAGGGHDDRMKVDGKDDGKLLGGLGEGGDSIGGPVGGSGGGAAAAADSDVTIPVDIKWEQGGEKVYVTGSFTGWRKMIGLAKQPDSKFLITLGLPLGTHRFRFVIDNELRFSDYLPTATDQMGNFVNYIEVTPELIREHLAKQDQGNNEDMEHQDDNYQPQKRNLSISSTRSDSISGLTNDDDDMGGGYTRYHDGDGSALVGQERDYISDIPPIFTDPKVMEQYYVAIDKQSKSRNGQQQAWLHPPHLPPHLENVILNNFNSMDRDNNSGALPIPNHVVLNHLATTSIKHNTLAVASVVRYKRKYITQVLYAPLQQ